MRPGDLIEKALFLVAFLSVLSTALIFFFLFIESFGIFQDVGPLDMLLGTEWQPTSENPRYGILPLIAGSLAISLGTLALALPIGLAVAIYMAEVVPEKVNEILKPVLEILAGVPSVVLGFFALVTLGPLISGIFGVSSGLTLLNGIIALSIMMIPTIQTVSEDAIRAVPRNYREASLALGATKWQTIKDVVVPAASNGILGAVLLAFGRAIGETMVVLMATGNAAIIPSSLLDPVRTMTSTMAAEMGEVGRGTAHYHALFALGALLFCITFAITFTVENFVKRKERTQ